MQGSHTQEIYQGIYKWEFLKICFICLEAQEAESSFELHSDFRLFSIFKVFHAQISILIEILF